MSGKLESFVDANTGKVQKSMSDRSKQQIDPQRQHAATNARVKVTRTAANSGQQRNVQNSARKTILHQGQQRATLEGSDLDDSTTTAPSRVQVEDSQFESQGRHMYTPAQNAEQHFDYEPNGSGGEDEDGEEYEDDSNEDEEEQPAHEVHADAIANINGFINADGVGTFELNKEGDSYPPTTSGHESNLDDSMYMQEEQAYEPQGAPVQPQNRSRSYGGLQQQQRNEIPGRGGHSGPTPVPPDARQQSFRFRQSNPAASATPGYGHPQAGPTGPRDIMSKGIAKAASNTRLAAKTADIPHSQIQHPTAAHQVNHFHIPRSIATVVAPPVASGTDFGPSSLAEVKVSPDDQAVFNKDFEVLHKESLDDRLTKARDVLPKEDATRPLQEQLQLARKLSEKEKHDFMASLSIDQWEETGDWFLGQFGELVNKMKDARKDRRKMAQSFGDEIRARHEQVAGKKRDIETALSAMGKSGACVLKSGTPKKARR